MMLYTYKPNRYLARTLSYYISFFLFFLLIDFSFSLNLPNRQTISAERYISDNNGNILINVNVWGHVNNPGRIMVDEGIDIATLLSLTGGPKKGANLKNIRIM